MTVEMKCFKKVEDTEPAKVFFGETYQAFTLANNSHRVVLNPQHDDPKQSVQVEIRGGERNPTDPLRFERVEIWEGAEDTMQTLSWHCDINGSNETERSGELVVCPTFEDYTEAGYRPASYPPVGCAIRASAGYDYYLANKADADAAWEKEHPDALNTKPVDDSLAPLKTGEQELKDERSLEELVAAGADASVILTAITALDYKSLERELVRLNVAVPKKLGDRQKALIDAVVKLGTV